MAEKESVIQKIFDLLLYLIPLLQKLPRSQKFLLADRLETKVLDVLDISVGAYYSPRSEKALMLKKANLSLEQIRYLVRLIHELRYINHERYGVISERVNEIGRMIGAWNKSLGST